MNISQPIGIFDSGIGGLTVTQAIVRHLPCENLIYFGDTAHLPYGDKSTATIQGYVSKVVQLLLGKHCKMILIACNTASAVAYELTKELVAGKALVINVIDPAIRYLAKHYANKKVGLIGTQRTIKSNIYDKKTAALNANIKLITHATPLLAKAIEEDFANPAIINGLLEEYLLTPAFLNIDALLLGCTHYPIIKENIRMFFPSNVEIIDSAVYVAAAVKACLRKNNLLNTQGQGEKQFFVSAYTENFGHGTQLFFSEKVVLNSHPL